MSWLIIGPPREKTYLLGFANIISKLATGEILIFYLVSLAEESGFSLAISKPQRQVLSRRGLYAKHV